MSSQNRRPASSSVAKRQASSENSGKGMAAVPPHHAAKKRPALANISNQRKSSFNDPSKGSVLGSSKMVPSTNRIPNAKKASSTGIPNAAFSRNAVPPASSVKPKLLASKKNSFPTKAHENSGFVIPQIIMDISPPSLETSSVSMDKSMSSCDSLKSPDIEYADNNDMAAVESIERKTCSKLLISEPEELSDISSKRGLVSGDVTMEEIADLDDTFADTQLCATMACDIYKHLRASEEKKRPSADFMEAVQKDVNVSMRAILVDWLVEVSEEYRLVPDTLYLAINYIDRYLSGNSIDRQRLQLLGVACMMIAAKYEEICAPQVEEFCYIADNTYFKEEVLQMESNVLNFLKFEMTAPTTKCFLRRFMRAALAADKAPSMQLECLANYLAELSLVEYNMLRYAPSLVAASAIFLANYVLFPLKRPWNSTLQHYTLYQPSQLGDCVKAMHSLCCNSHSSSLPAIREKYSQHKYKFVAKKYCPPTIPLDYFQNTIPDTKSL